MRNCPKCGKPSYRITQFCSRTCFAEYEKNLRVRIP